MQYFLSIESSSIQSNFSKNTQVPSITAFYFFQLFSSCFQPTDFEMLMATNIIHVINSAITQLCVYSGLHAQNYIHLLKPGKKDCYVCCQQHLNSLSSKDWISPWSKRKGNGELANNFWTMKFSMYTCVVLWQYYTLSLNIIHRYIGTMLAYRLWMLK